MNLLILMGKYLYNFMAEYETLFKLNIGERVTI